MGRLHRQFWCAATALLVPWLTLASPTWLKLAGVGPSWAVLWLLPWALVDGPLSGAVAGLALGLCLDSLHLGPVTQAPALVLLGWWWGRLGRQGPPIQRSFNLGLLALLGSLAVGLSVLLQLLWGPAAWPGPALQFTGLQVLIAQTLITALLAPMLCSLQVLLWRHQSAMRP